MLELWVWITLFAVVMQVVRHSLQKHLTTCMSSIGVVCVRFVFGLPFGFLYYGILKYFSGGALIPSTTIVFWGYCFCAAVTQILGTLFLILLFRQRNFAVGITYTKTEIVQSALLGLLLVGDQISLAGYGAIVISMTGVMILSAVGGKFDLNSILTGLFTRAAVYGVLSGFGIAAASVFIRAAALELTEGGFLLKAGFVLVIVLSIEVFLIVFYLILQDKSEIQNIIRRWKPGLMVGIFSALGSVGWFSAMTLERVAYVKTVSQLEVILSILVSYLVFKERSRVHELIGMSLVVTAIIVLLLMA